MPKYSLSAYPSRPTTLFCGEAYVHRPPALPPSEKIRATARTGTETRTHSNNVDTLSLTRAAVKALTSDNSVTTAPHTDFGNHACWVESRPFPPLPLLPPPLVSVTVPSQPLRNLERPPARHLPHTQVLSRRRYGISRASAASTARGKNGNFTRACYGPFVWAGSGRADRKIVMGQAGPGGDF